MKKKDKGQRVQMEDHKGDFPWWSIPSLGVNYDPRLFGLLRESGLTGPLWQHLRRLSAAKAQRGRPARPTSRWRSGR